MTHPKGTLTRNTTAARINHWITAACFVLLLLSGLSMFHPILFFLSELFGGGQWTRAVHPWIGVMLLVSYAGLIVQFWRDNLWTRDDIAWMGSINRVLVNEEEGVPEVDRFNGSLQAPLARAKHIELHGRLAEGSAADHPVIETVLKIEGGSVQEVHPLLTEPFDADVRTMLSGLKDFSPKPWPVRFREIQAAGGHVEIVQSRVAQGDLVAVAAGINALGKEAVLEGKKARAFPLRFVDGAVFLGPLKVGQTPPLF